MFALKPFKFTYMQMKIFENPFPHVKTYKLCMLSTAHIIPDTTFGNEQCLKLSLGV